jgi:phosphopentomutase
MKYNRIILLILDSVGCGFQDDYKEYHNQKANTLKSIYSGVKGFSLPNLERLGIDKVLFDKDVSEEVSFYGKAREMTAGNDTFAGVWEMFGVVFNNRFRSSEDKFSDDIVEGIEKKFGVGIVGNEYISGFKALDKYYKEHKEKKGPIMYMAGDGVVLLAAHENIVSHDKLNEYGEILADTLKDQGLSRVITRPFNGEPGNFIRTENRKDFINKAYNFDKSLIDVLDDVNLVTTEHLYHVLGSPNIKSEVIDGNHENNKLLDIIINSIEKKSDRELMFFCLQDFDMFGHKKDIEGYARALKEFDNHLPKIQDSLNEDDLLIITADHGCDPSIDIRGHTREYVPLILFSKMFKEGGCIGVRTSFSDIGQTISHNFTLTELKHGNVINEIF